MNKEQTMAENEITVKSIREHLDKLGIMRDDKVVMHSNLRSLGKARILAKLSNWGADHIIDAFLEQMGPNGILCVPTFTETFMSAGGPSGQIFDPETTPSRVGSITNVVLRRKESVRSLHPTHSWSAIGKDADEFVKGHEATTTFGRDSICGRMYDWDFKIVWFGTTGQTNTSTHFGEDWLDLPNMTSVDALVKDGNSFKKVTVFREPTGPRNFYELDSKVDRELRKWKIQTSGKVHNADVHVMRHREFMNRLLNALIENPCLLLYDDRQDAYHTLFYRLNNEHMDNLKKTKGGAQGILEDLGCTLE